MNFIFQLNLKLPKIQFRQLALFVALLLLSANIFAQVDFKVQVSKTSMAVGETFQVTFTVNTTGNSFRPPAMKEFRRLSGPNNSTSMSWVNGNMTQSAAYSFILMAVQEGDYTIEPATIQVNGVEYKTQPLKIKVSKSSNPNVGSQQNASNQNAAGANENVFLTVNVDKRKAFLGEQITASYKLYLKVDILNYSFPKNPALNGFWAQDINQKGTVNLVREYVDGVPYQMAELKKTILFPQRSGELIIDPIEMELIARIQERRQSNNIFDNMFGTYRDVKMVVSSKPIKIQVEPLPNAGKPLSFSGAVGNFNLKTTIDKQNIKTNEAITLKMTISGKGNLKLIQAPKPIFPSDFEVYDPKIIDNIKTEISGVSGSRTYEYLLIPRHPGKFKIDPLEFSWFNPSTEKYESAKSDSYDIIVEKGKEEDNVIISNRNRKEDIQLTGTDIMYIKSEMGELENSNIYILDKPWYYLLLSAPLLLFILFYFYYRKMIESEKDIIGMKRKKANKIAVKRLENAKRLMDADKKSEFYEEIFKALYGYLSDKLHIPISELNKSKISDKLLSNGMSNEMLHKLLKTLDQSEMARFAPSASTIMITIYNDASEVIGEIENTKSFNL